MVQCVNCGFLSLRHNSTLRLDEAPMSFRETGVPKNNEGATFHDHIPVCFKGAAHFKKEMASSRKASFGEQVLHVITQDRTCSQITEWHQGYAPKEHNEMIQQKELLEWQRQCQKDDRDWRENQAKREREWRKEDRRTAMITLVLSVLTTFVATVATLIAASRFPWYPQLEPPAATEKP
ncbi:MAG: hypothetical protein IT428_10120 [Planctomycetaceae bacterium]|nr:hypothetical protein [Planctomycetaceae bacterium]